MHRKSSGVGYANGVRVLSSCHSMQSQMGIQINDSRQRLDLHASQVHQVHIEQQIAAINRSHMNQQISNDQERLTRTQQQHEQNYAHIQGFASQVENQFQQLSHSDVQMGISSAPGGNADSRTSDYQNGSQPRESSFDVYPRPLMANQRRASNPELGPADRQFGGVNTPARAESQTYIPNAKISPVPAFEVTRYSNWRREIKFWKDLHGYIPESQLISFLGLNGGIALRPHVVKMFRDTEQNESLRTFQTLMSILDDHYAMTAREQDMNEMGKLFSLKRDAMETVQAFWARFDTQLSNLEGSATSLTDDLLLIRALKSLNLSYTQRSNLLSLMEGRGFAHSLANLRKCSILLMGAYKGLDAKDNSRDERKITTQSCLSEEQSSDEPHVLGNGEEVWIVRRGGKKGRPGLESQALRKTAAGMNVRADSSAADKKIQLQCYRGGSKEHSLRTCAEPFAPVLAFAPKKPGVGRDSIHAM